MIEPTPTPPGTTGGPVDFTAILSALQDQLDDLTATVEAHQRRLDALDGGDADSNAFGPADHGGR